MKTIILLTCVLVNGIIFSQNRTPELSEMGSLKQEAEPANPPVLAEKDTVIIVNDENKRGRARRMQKKAALTEAKKAETLE